MGVTPETLRRWVRQMETDSGKRDEALRPETRLAWDENQDGVYGAKKVWQKYEEEAKWPSSSTRFPAAAEMDHRSERVMPPLRK